MHEMPIGPHGILVRMALTVLSSQPKTLSPVLAAITTVAKLPPERKGGGIWTKLANRLGALPRARALLRQAGNHDIVIESGTSEGLLFAALLRLHGGKRPILILWDCLWYRPGWLRRAWMRFCLQRVDRCMVWASAEVERYARAYGLPRSKFMFVPFHDTLEDYEFQVSEGDYLFAGGNSDRDYAVLFAAVEGLDVRCEVAVTDPETLRGLKVPENVSVVALSHDEFRQHMAESRAAIVPLKAGLLRTAGHQTFLNAMWMGKPVVVTDIEGGTDYIEHGVTGLLTPCADAAALREAIVWLLQHPEEAREMGKRARTVAQTLTTIRTNTEIWQHALEIAEESAPLTGEALDVNPAAR